MNIQDRIAKLDAEIAPLTSQIAAINAAVAPVDAEIDALCEAQNALKEQEAPLVAKLNAARGMPPDEYVALKKHYGQLCGRRMALINALKDETDADDAE